MLKMHPTELSTDVDQLVSQTHLLELRELQTHAKIAERHKELLFGRNLSKIIKAVKFLFEK